MTNPAKPAASNGGGSPSADAQVPGSLAEAVAAAAKQPPAKQKDPDEKWAEMGGELYDALKADDKASFGKLFIRQVRLAVREAMRGNQR